MLVSGGKVLAIDKVKHDGATLTGDGCFVPLGVVGFLTEKAADKLYQKIGNYVDAAQLNNYYTKAAADTKFAEIKNVYTKSQTDALLEGLTATFEMAGAADAVKTWVTNNYLDKYVVSSTYNTTAKAEEDKQILFGAINNVDSNLSVRIGAAEDAIRGIYNAGYVNVSGLNSYDPDKQYAIYWKGADRGWDWQEVTGGGGGGGGDTVTAENGLTADFRSGKRWIGMQADYLSVLEYASTAYQTWDTVTGKQAQLSNEQLSAISSVSSLAEQLDDTLPITGGTLIDVSEKAGGVTISYTGNTVMFTENKTTATAANTVYLVLEDVG